MGNVIKLTQLWKKEKDEKVLEVVFKGESKVSKFRKGCKQRKVGQKGVCGNRIANASEHAEHVLSSLWVILS